MSEQTEIVDRKEKVWKTLVNGGLRDLKDKGAPLWAIAQIYLLWQIYEKLNQIGVAVAILMQHAGLK